MDELHSADPDRSTDDAVVSGATTDGSPATESVDFLATFDALDDLERGTVRTNDVDTAYYRRGSGPPVVFVHPLGMSGTVWAPQLAALGDDYDVVAYDTRGHGHTGGSDVTSYDMHLYASDLRALLDALDVDRPVIVGSSMGGAVVQQYAATYPDDVAGVALVDTFSTTPLGVRGRLVMGFVQVLARLDRVVAYETLNRFQMRVYETLAPGSAGNGDAILDLMAADPPIAHRELVKAADACAAFPRSDLDPAAITAPTLVLYGDAIPGVLREMSTRLAATLLNADVDVRVVPGGGHGSIVDDPRFVTAAIREFVDGLA
ncbi:alpha/beta hydrolase [Halorubellus sp. JP-L1]|uniref:alpha/beta fold hydrolase n=1 Tax=Halorubellus sp. JP-L1 TaxID=2715753 RepID=UPI0014072F07|nr:alpha/beta hydrolase [Halorubellus sp. JP-L1]NHN43396.1 alpha/beta hydrolase [Halorubellus sp. JP-L1]